MASRWGKLGGQSVGGVGGGGGPQRGCRAHGPHRIAPLCTRKPPSPSLWPPLPESLGSGGVSGWPVGGRRWPVRGGPFGQSVGVGRPPVRRPLSAGGGRGCRWPKASLGQVGLSWPVGGGPGEGVPVPSLRRPVWPSPDGQWGAPNRLGVFFAPHQPTPYPHHPKLTHSHPKRIFVGKTQTH